MKIANHIKSSLDACDGREPDKAMLFACLAVDGTAKKMYPEIRKVGERFRKFIIDHLDIIELMFGGLNLQETVFPFNNNKGNIGIKFEDIVYEKFRCNLAHGNELPDGYDIAIKIANGFQQFMIDINGQSMTLPESAIYALVFFRRLMQIKKLEATFITIAIPSIYTLLIAGGEKLSALETSWTLKTKSESRWILLMYGHQNKLSDKLIQRGLKAPDESVGFRPKKTGLYTNLHTLLIFISSSAGTSFRRDSALFLCNKTFSAPE